MLDTVGLTIDRGEAKSDPVARILDAAELCFGRSGYAGASIREIAEIAGVSKSLVHYHFGTKERLVAALQIRLDERLAARVRDAVARRGGTPAERALVGLDALLETVRDGGPLTTQAVLAATSVSNPALSHELARVRDESRRLLCEIALEILGPDPGLPITLEHAADVVIAALLGIGLQAALGERPEHTEMSALGLRALVAATLVHVARRETEAP